MTGLRQVVNATSTDIVSYNHIIALTAFQENTNREV
jgi:hypothetical protein